MTQYGLGKFSLGRGRAIGSVAVLLAGVLAAGCASAPKSKHFFSSKEYGVAASRRVVEYGQPVPHGGGREMVGQPYVVAGRLYRPMVNERYAATGIASWYGKDFHGRETANGEVYDMDSLSAAHPTLPLPSYAKVTNLTNGRSVMVRINDRGPYVGDRLIDLSAKAADLLDFQEAGMAKVKVEYAGMARLDGRDEAMLMASYRGPGAPKIMLADARPAQRGTAPATPVATGGIQAAGQSAAAERSNSQVGGIDQVVYGRGGMTAKPGSAVVPRPSTISGLISGSVRSYAQTSAPAPAQAAISGIVKSEDKPIAPGVEILLKIGVFVDAGSAKAMATRLGPYGRVRLTEIGGASRRLTAVEILVDQKRHSVDDVLAEAVRMGAKGARRA